jgi:hypothetical protein
MTDPILISIAAALTGKGAATLYDIVKKKFVGSPEATAALEKARSGGPDSPQVYVLSEELARAERADPVFVAELRAVWGEFSVQQRAGSGGAANQISGTVTGKVLQACDVHGGMSL